MDSALQLHIVTPCARPGNIRLIADSILAAPVPAGTVLRWHILIDDRFGIDVDRVRQSAARVSGACVEVCHSAGLAGHAQRNHALEKIESGWIVFVDDDNLLHSDLPDRLAEAIRGNPDAGVIAYDQDLGGGFRRASPDNVYVGGIDSAQYALERAFVGNERFDVYAYSADGILVTELYRRAPWRFIFLPAVLATYNALNPGRWGETPPGRRELGPLPNVHTAGSLHFHRSFETRTAGVPHCQVASTGDELRIDAPKAGERASEAVLRSPIGVGARRLRGLIRVSTESTHSVIFRLSQRFGLHGERTVARMPLDPSEMASLTIDLEGSRADSSELEFGVRMSDGARKRHRASVLLSGVLIQPIEAVSTRTPNSNPDEGEQ